MLFVCGSERQAIRCEREDPISKPHDLIAVSSHAAIDCSGLVDTGEVVGSIVEPDPRPLVPSPVFAFAKSTSEREMPTSVLEIVNVFSPVADINLAEHCAQHPRTQCAVLKEFVETVASLQLIAFHVRVSVSCS